MFCRENCAWVYVCAREAVGTFVQHTHNNTGLSQIRVLAANRYGNRLRQIVRSTWSPNMVTAYLDDLIANYQRLGAIRPRDDVGIGLLHHLSVFLLDRVGVLILHVPPADRVLNL